jgi:hypothetical protein
MRVDLSEAVFVEPTEQVGAADPETVSGAIKDATLLKD